MTHVAPEYVAVIGSRPEAERANQREYDAAFERDYRREKAIAEYIATLPFDAVIVSGAAPGADRWAELHARRLCMQLVICYPAVHKRDGQYDPVAYRRRNESIARIADRCVAFYGADKSPGTTMCVGFFRALGKPVEEIKLFGKTEPLGKRITP